MSDSQSGVPPPLLCSICSLVDLQEPPATSCQPRALPAQSMSRGDRESVGAMNELHLHRVQPRELAAAVGEKLQLRLEVVAVVDEAQRVTDYRRNLSEFI